MVETFFHQVSPTVLNQPPFCCRKKPQKSFLLFIKLKMFLILFLYILSYVHEKYLENQEGEALSEVASCSDSCQRNDKS